MRVNLIPPALQRRMLIQMELRTWIPWWLMLASICGLAILWNYQSLRNEQRQVAKLSERAHPLEVLQQQTAKVERQIRELNSKRSALLAIQPTDRCLGILMVLNQAAQAAGDRMQVQNMRMLKNASTSAPHSSGANSSPHDAPRSTSTLSLSAVTVGDTALAQFVNALRASSVFEQVDLKSSTRWDSADVDGREFHLECRFAE